MEKPCSVSEYCTPYAKHIKPDMVCLFIYLPHGLHCVEAGIQQEGNLLPLIQSVPENIIYIVSSKWPLNWELLPEALPLGFTTIKFYTEKFKHNKVSG